MLPRSAATSADLTACSCFGFLHTHSECSARAVRLEGGKKEEREGERGRGGRGERGGEKGEKERERGREKRREEGPAPKVQLRSEALHTAVKIFFGGCAPRPRLVVEGEGCHSTSRQKCEGEIGKGEQGASDALTQTCCCLTEPLSHDTLRHITPKTAAWARDRAETFLPRTHL